MWRGREIWNTFTPTASFTSPTLIGAALSALLSTVWSLEEPGSDRDSFPQLSETACAARVRVELCSRSGFSFFAVRDQKEGERVKPQASCSACFKPV